VLEKEAVADALVADVITSDEVIGAVNGQPAVVAVPDRVTDDRAAAHRVAAEVEVQRIAAEDALLAEVPEFGVRERAGRIAMIHRVAADAVGGRRLDDHVPAE